MSHTLLQLVLQCILRKFEYPRKVGAFPSPRNVVPHSGLRRKIRHGTSTVAIKCCQQLAHHDRRMLTALSGYHVYTVKFYVKVSVIFSSRQKFMKFYITIRVRVCLCICRHQNRQELHRTNLSCCRQPRPSLLRSVQFRQSVKN